MIHVVACDECVLINLNDAECDDQEQYGRVDPENRIHSARCKWTGPQHYDRVRSGYAKGECRHRKNAASASQVPVEKCELPKS